MDLSAAGAPAVPTHCLDSSDTEATCGECFTEAVRRIDAMRFNLERLRCVYKATQRFADASISFGDSMAGATGVAGTQWQVERIGILKSVEQLEGTYDEKYRQMMPNLQKAIELLGGCEERFFQERDWYARYGFIYYTFMADRYKRSD